MQQVVHQQAVPPFPGHFRLSSSQFMLPPGPALAGNATAVQLETLAVLPLDVIGDAAQTSLAVEFSAGGHSGVSSGGSDDPGQIGDQTGWIAWHVSRNTSESRADLPSLVADLRDLPTFPPSIQREYEMTASFSDMGRRRGMSTMRSDPLRLDGSSSVTNGNRKLAPSMHLQEVSRSLSQTYNDNEASRTDSQDLQGLTTASNFIPWAGDRRGQARRTTSDIEAPPGSKSTKILWSTITLGRGSDEKIWHIAVSTVRNGSRGHVLRLYITTTRKGCKPVQDWTYKMTAAPEHSIAAALRTVGQDSGYQTLKQEQMLSADDEHSLLSALDGRYGDVWNSWRDGWGTWREWPKNRKSYRKMNRRDVLR